MIHVDIDSLMKSIVHACNYVLIVVIFSCVFLRGKECNRLCNYVTSPMHI